MFKNKTSTLFHLQNSTELQSLQKFLLVSEKRNFQVITLFPWPELQQQSFQLILQRTEWLTNESQRVAASSMNSWKLRFREHWTVFRYSPCRNLNQTQNHLSAQPELHVAVLWDTPQTRVISASPKSFTSAKADGRTSGDWRGEGHPHTLEVCSCHPKKSSLSTSSM